MDRIRLQKRSNFFYYMSVILLTSGIIFLSYRLLANSSFMVNRNVELGKGGDLAKETYDSNISRDVNYSQEDKGFFSEIWIRIKGMSISDPTSILSTQMPYLIAGQIGKNVLDTEIVEASDENIVLPVMNPSEELSRQGDRRPNITIDDEPENRQESDGKDEELPDEIKIQINKIIDNTPLIALTGQGPQVLIYHTHSREAYRQDPKYPYKDIAVFRSSDLNHTVLGVGEELAKQLQGKGIPVLHERTDHEVYKWESGLYPQSLKTMEKAIKEYPSLKIFLDIHRNYNKSYKDPDKEVVVINGQRVAKFFVLIGTGEGISGGFGQKPNWRENYQFALKITNKANEKYPGLAGEIGVQTGRYNQHISTKAILIEVGNHLTTLEEAKRTAVYLAEIISEIIEK